MKFTGSKTDLALRCAYPFRADIHVARTESTEASAGTAEHAAIDGTISAPDEDPDPESATHARWISEWWESERQHGDWMAEVAIAINPRTGHTILVPRDDSTGHRDYSSVPDGYIPSTADGLLVSHDRARVVDWKTGQGAAYKRREIVRGADGRDVARQVGWQRPAELGQLLTLGAAVARHFGVRRVSLELVLCNEHRLHVETEEVGLLDLRLHEGVLLDIVTRLQTTDVQPTPGPWCSALYCPLLGHCSATSRALAQVAPSRWRYVTHSDDFDGPEHVGAQHAALDAAQARIDAGRLAVRMYLKEHGPALLSDGSRLAMETRANERLNIAAPGALDALKAALPGTWESAVETVTVTRSSKERIYDAVKPGVDAAKTAAKAAGEPVRHLTYAAAQRRVLEALARVDGAVRRSEYEVPVIVPPTAPAAFPESGKASLCSWCGVEHAGGPEACP